MRRFLFPAILLIIGIGSINAQSVDDVAKLFNTGAEANNSGNYAMAISSFEKCIEMADEVGEEAYEYVSQAEGFIPRLYYNLAMDKLKSEKYEEASKDFEKAVEICESYGNTEYGDKSKKYLSKAYYAYANDLRKADDITNAVFYYKKSIEIEEDYSKPYYYLGMIAKDQNRDEDMIANFVKLIEVGDSKDKMVSAGKTALLKYYFELGQASVKGKNYVNGISALNEALKYGGNDNSSVYYFLAEAYNATEKWSDAASAAQKCADLENVPIDKAKGFYQLGFAKIGQGDNSGACEAFKNASYGNFEASAKYQIETVLKCN